MVSTAEFKNGIVKIKLSSRNNTSKVNAIIIIKLTVDDYMYYLDNNEVTCRDITIENDYNDPYTITYDVLFVSILSTSTDTSGNGIIFRSDKTTIGGVLKENENEVEFYNEKKYYKSVSYIPQTIGEFTLKYALKVKVSDTYYLSSSLCEIKIVNNCYEQCETCSTFGNDDAQNCNKCKKNYYKIENTNNCYKKALNGYYFDKTNSLYKKCMSNCFLCTDSTTCTRCEQDFSLLSEYTGNVSDSHCIPSCIKERWYINETSNEFECLTGKDDCVNGYSCYNKTTLRCYPTSFYTTSLCTIPKDENNIMDFLETHVVELAESNYVENTENYSTIVYDATRDTPSNLTKVDLGECEVILREEYSVNEKENFLFTQIDHVKTSIADFSVFTPKGVKVDLALCDGSEMIISTPMKSDLAMSIGDIQTFKNSGVDVFNTSDDFFNDKCHSFSSSENSSDVTLEERRKNYYQNVTLCAEGCTYNGINLTTLVVSCACIYDSTQNKGEGTNSFGSSVLSSFMGEITKSNIGVVKCYNVVFKFSTLKKNVGFIMFSILKCFQIVNILCFVINARLIYSKYIFGNPPENNKIIFSESHNNSENSFVTNSNMVIGEKPKKNLEQFHKHLDDIDFQTAQIEDHRQFFPLLLWRIKHFHPIYVAFFSDSSASIKNVSISLLILGTECDFAINAIFYSDDYISNSSENGGAYDFLYSITKIIYSTLIGVLISLLCGMFSVNMSEDTKTKSPRKEAEERKMLQISKVKITLTIFYIIVMLFSVFFWYFVSAFCGVYQKSQKNWILDSLSSFGISMLIPFVLSFVVTLTRILSLKLSIGILFYLSTLIEHM